MSNTITIHNARTVAAAHAGVTATGREFVEVRVADNRRTRNAAGEWIDAEATFWDVTHYGAGSVALGESLVSGTEVVIVGEVVTDAWDKDGTKHTRTKILAQKIAPVAKGAEATRDQL